jgi:hypothetical protein
MATFYTNSSSSLATLSAVAYGDSYFFREVHTQIKTSSLFQELYRSVPSQLFMAFLPSTDYLVTHLSDVLEELLHDYYLINQNKIKSYADLISRVVQNVLYIVDAHSFYDLSFYDLWNLAFTNTLSSYTNSSVSNLAESLAQASLDSLSENTLYFENLLAFYNIIKNNHTTKISDLPDNALIRLSDTVKLLENYKTSIPYKDYALNRVYRIEGMENDYASLSENYTGYIGAHLSNPTVMNGARTENISSPTATTPAFLNLSLTNKSKGVYDV